MKPIYGYISGFWANKSFTVEETAVYTVVYTFNADTKVVSETTTKTGEAGAISHTYTVAGASTALWGTEWDPTNETNDMVGTEGVYTWTKDNVVLDGQEIKFKVCVDHAWSTSYPTNDWVIGTDYDEYDGEGYYDVKITFTESTKEIVVDLKKHNTTYTATFVNGKGWENVYAYVWNGEGDGVTKLNGNFPGVQLSKSGTTTIDEKEYDVYSFSLVTNSTKEPESIIFSDGTDANKTEDLDFEQNKQYAVNLPTKYTVYFKKNAGDWDEDAVFAYAWNGNGEGATPVTVVYPGDDITATASEGVYTYKYWGYAAPEYILFNNGEKDEAKKKQTTDEAFVDGKTYEKVNNIAVTVSGEFSTYSNASYALDFSATTIKAYKATVNGEGKVVLTKVDKVPAGAGVLLKANEKIDVAEEIPTAINVAALDGNLFKATDGTADIEASTEGKYNYVLQTNNGVQGFYNVNAKIAAPAAGKAYLQTSTELTSEAGARTAWIFADGETTGINSVREAVNNGRFYNLAGQRVATPTKGLYIVNGKKVIVK